MATTNLSEYKPLHIEGTDQFRIAVVYAAWNDFVTTPLRDGAVNTLVKEGVREDQIEIFEVPGSFELSFGCMHAAKTGRFDAVIAVGCVIRGETPHFDYVCAGVTQGITEINITTDVPAIYCLLTTEDKEQALARAGGIHGNKGVEAAVAALEMIDFKRKLAK